MAIQSMNMQIPICSQTPHYRIKDKQAKKSLMVSTISLTTIQTYIYWEEMYNKLIHASTQLAIDLELDRMIKAQKRKLKGNNKGRN